jgi:DNA transformation protein
VSPDDIRDLFAAFGPVVVRRMFGGAGIYADGMMFALIADDVIYLKVDEGNAPAFEREGCEPLSYTARNGKRAVMSYRRIPDRLLDDPDELARWAVNAVAAAGRAAARKQPRARMKNRPERPRRAR